MKQLKSKYSSVIPFNGFYAIMLFGTLIRRNEYKGTKIPLHTLNHEGIHVCQAEDFCKGFIGFICFYLLYFIEWFLKLIPCFLSGNNAYRSISFEQEALDNDLQLDYQDNREKFAWAKNIFKLRPKN